MTLLLQNLLHCIFIKSLFLLQYSFIKTLINILALKFNNFTHKASRFVPSVRHDFQICYLLPCITLEKNYKMVIYK